MQGRLSSSERKDLIQWLCTAPLASDVEWRRSLLVGCPEALTSTVTLTGPAYVVFSRMIDIVDGPAWAYLPKEGTWTILTLIQNALVTLAGGTTGAELQRLLEILQERIAPQKARRGSKAKVVPLPTTAAQNVDEAHTSKGGDDSNRVKHRLRAPTPARRLPARALVPARSRTQVFISYSRKDVRWLERLQTHLRPLVRQGTLDVWDDTRIQPGADWEAEIAQALARARVAVLLVTPDFLASDFVATEELPRLLDAADREGLTILWVPVRPSAYERSPIARYQAAHDPARPLSGLNLNQRDHALVQICKIIVGAAGAPRE